MLQNSRYHLFGEFKGIITIGCEEYDKFNKTQKIESDFDKAIKELEKKNKKK